MRPAQTMSYPSFEDFRDRSRSFAAVAAIDELTYSYGSGPQARPVNVTLVTGQYFPMLEVQPLLGRLFGEAEDVLSFAVTQRTQELGIRAALGATPGRLMRLILGSGVVTAVVGTVLGIGLAVLVSGRIAPLLFRTAAVDVTVYVVTAATILGVAVLASWIPGRRATRVEPVRALKAE